MAGYLQPIAFIQMPGSSEWLIILFIALLIFGRRLPEVARSLGKSVNEFKRGMREFQDSANEVASDVSKVTDDAMSEGDTYANSTTYEDSSSSYDGQTTYDSQMTDESGQQAGVNDPADEPTPPVGDESNPDKSASANAAPTDTFPEPMS
jgi:sec-independent protein translocase protein TatA